MDTSNYRNSIEIGVQGQKTLPAAAYLCERTFAEEQHKIFSNQWLCVARAHELNTPGEFKVRQIGQESIIIVRDLQGDIRAFFNVCRHRGTLLCEASRGTFQRTIQCPYHAWTYALDGRLVGVPDEKQLENFCREDHGLHPVACQVWEGFVFIHLGLQPEPFASVFDVLHGRFAKWNLPTLVPLGKRDYMVSANWKLIVQNYSECYHCAPVHPRLVKLSPPTSGGNDLVEGPFLGGYMEIATLGGSLTLSGQACGASVGEFSPAERQRVYYYVLFPNMFLSLHHDYVMVHTLWPQSPGQTRVECEWLFHPDSANTSRWNPEDGIAFWDQTNREDWHMSELTQRGVASARYAPGPYSNREAMSAAFDRTYLRTMRQFSSNAAR